MPTASRRPLALVPLALVALATLLSSARAGAHTKLLRHPSYHDGKVVFSYFGSLWVANDDGSNVRRITVNRARDIYPRFSPDGKWIAFSSNRAGNYDVYVMSADGGKPRQLTFHTADDMVVGWTPDGHEVLFQSSRDKGAFPTVATLFQVPFDPEQEEAKPNAVAGAEGDGNGTSNGTPNGENAEAAHNGDGLGALEQPLPVDWGSWGSFSPDGKKLAFTRHPGVWSRKHYRGSYAVDLWLLDVDSKDFTRLGDGDYKGNYLWPMYGHDGQVYFVADILPDEKGVKFGSPEVMKSANNIWKLPEAGGPPVQVTHHSDGNLFFPSMSPDGKTIVYEENFGLWKLDTATGKTVEIPIDIQSDGKDNDVELRTFREADGFSLSPSTKRAAVSIHGEIFTIATDRGEVQRVTQTPWREREPRWSPDGKRIVFISDRSGREEIWSADELGHNLKQLSDADCDKGSVVWAHDSKSLLWAGSDHKLRRVEVDGVKTTELTSSDVGAVGSPQFSPDGKWVSYSKMDKSLRPHVYVRRLEGGDAHADARAEHVIETEDFLMSEGAKWSPDGKTLLLLGGVGAPGMSSLNRTNLQLYSVALTRVTKDPSDRDVDTEAQAESRGAERGDGQGGGGRTIPRRFSSGTTQPSDTTRPSGPEVKEIKIEWDGLERRIRQLTHFDSGSVFTVVPSPDSHTYAFVAFGGDSEGGGGAALYTINEDGSRLTRVSGGAPDLSSGGRRRGGGGGAGEPQWSRDGRTIYFLQGGGLYSVAVSPAPSDGTGSSAGGFSRGGGSEAGPSASPRRVDFSVRIQIDRPAERRQVFDEAWRVMRNRFYDPKMHGVNWDAARKTFEPLLADVSDREELQSVIMEMIGELNASHTGISGGEDPADADVERIQTRYPGFDLEPDPSGYYKVSYLYRKGPADHDYVRLKPGDFILAVNGHDLKVGDNYWKRFNLVPGRKFEFTVNSEPKREGAWTVGLEPLPGVVQADLEYDRWVYERKSMVAKLSKGKVGYLHIRAMDARSFQKFERDFLDNLDKQALIIDERFNGGGGIDQELLEILNQRKKYQFWRSRDSVDVSRPVQAFFGPMVVLQNERSASNAEMFPEGFRALGLGKVIGMPTYGAVIGTGSYRLMDGASLRTPTVGVFTATGQSLENYGVQPDVTVDNTPSDFRAGRDRQIEKALEVLAGESSKESARKDGKDEK